VIVPVMPDAKCTRQKNGNDPALVNVTVHEPPTLPILPKPQAEVSKALSPAGGVPDPTGCGAPPLIVKVTDPPTGTVTLAGLPLQGDGPVDLNVLLRLLRARPAAEGERKGGADEDACKGEAGETTRR
jgi:hypothetical protein